MFAVVCNLPAGYHQVSSYSEPRGDYVCEICRNVYADTLQLH